MSDSTPNTQSVCKCDHPPAVHDRLGCAMIGCTCRHFEPVAEPASTGEPKCTAIVNDHGFVPDICGLPLGHEGEHKYVEAARPSEPSAPQTDVPYLKRCAAEGWDCGCVDVCKFAAAPQPVSGDAPKVEEIARKIIRKFADKYGNVGVSHQDIDMISDLLCSYFPSASTVRKSPDSHLGAVRD